MWKKSEVGEDWRRAIILPLYKKSNKMVCNNYRGIRLLSVPSKVYVKTLGRWLRSKTESRVLEVQGASKSGRSCVNQIFRGCRRQPLYCFHNAIPSYGFA